MPKFVRFVCSGALLRIAAGLALGACLAACGQRGPLYLPTDPAAAGRPTLPQILLPGTTGNPTPPATDVPGSTGTGSANPVRSP